MENPSQPAEVVNRPKRIGRIAVGDAVHRARKRFPEKMAFVVPSTGETLTYAEFDRRTNQAARAFRRAGLEKGDRVATLCDNSLQFITAFFGTVKASMVFVPLSPEMTVDGVRYELAHSDADALLVDGRLYRDVEPAVDRSALNVLVSVSVDGESTPLPTFRR